MNNLIRLIYGITFQAGTTGDGQSGGAAGSSEGTTTTPAPDGAKPTEGSGSEEGGSPEGGSGEAYWKERAEKSEREARKAYGVRDEANKKLRTYESSQELERKANLEKNQEFEKLYKETQKLLDDQKPLVDAGTKWIEHVKKQVDEAKKALTKDQVSTLEEISSDPEKQLGLISKLFPKSNENGGGTPRPTGKGEITQAQLSAMAPKEQALHFANGGTVSPS